MGTVNCKSFAEDIIAKAAVRGEKVAEKLGRKPLAAIISVGDNDASKAYIRGKINDIKKAGMEVIQLSYSEDGISEESLLRVIHWLNISEYADGIIVQLPLPEGFSEQVIAEAICPEKDLDGFSPYNIGRMSLGKDSLRSCTPAGIIRLLDEMGETIEGKSCVIVGRSNIVGKPLAMMMTQRDATVTLAHSKTKDLKEVTSKADILVVAVGSQNLITRDYVKEGAIVIDVGINRGENGKLCGDVNLIDVADKAGVVTPVPGGVGLLTRAMLVENLVKAAEMRGDKSE